MSQTVHHVSEQEARKVAEASREAEWKQPSFLRELFLGNFRLDLVHPYPLVEEERPEFAAFYRAFREFLATEVDPIAIDASGEYPDHVIEGLRKLGAFGLKIPKRYGGLGFNMLEYSKLMELLGSVDGNVEALLSAHQSIGVPTPLLYFGSEEQKLKYLPRCAAGDISGFALTEPDVGSDPARLATTAELSDDGSHYVLNGTKLWCTNGTIAKLLVVMARHPDTKKISAFVVETDWPGVRVEHRCHFMGLRALANAVLSFTDVRVPVANRIGEEGRGLRIALTTLNTGRLAIPAGSVGSAKMCLEISRKWAAERVQWGRPVGKHEAISHLLADMAATTYAMESMTELACQMADRGGYDIRLEAAAAKLWATERGWRIVDDLMQIRGGRGYETARSLAARGEEPIPVEQIFRDYRINRIFEGSSEIMRLFMAREAVDKHLEVAGDIIDPEKPAGAKLAAFLRAGAFYLAWYPTRWLGWGRWPRYAEFGALAEHLRFVERSARKLARQVLHGMLVHRAKLQFKQGFLFRLVDITDELFAMAASVSRAHALAKRGDPQAERAGELADLFCRGARREVGRLFHELWSNDDVRKYKAGVAVVDGRHDWIHAGTIGLDEHQAAGAGEPVHAERPAPVAAARG
ncbi:MAG TPA: acyl-CoA dehydrogenase family protein [Thermoanaerobaculia bacterium]|nr:acyl-CoA dehydrogenase family protein [Thermoanaerobaculia bacterium]